VPTTQPESIEQYSIRVADQWKIGRTRVDDGVILVVARNDRTVRIEVGYGLEGAITDLGSPTSPASGSSMSRSFRGSARTISTAAFARRPRA
jgi:hypothetical protein